MTALDNGKETPGKEIELDDDARALVHQIHEAQDAIETAQQRKDGSRVKLMAKMGDAAVGVLPSAGLYENGSSAGEPLPGERVYFKHQTRAAETVVCECGRTLTIVDSWDGRILRYPNREEKKG